MTKLLVVDDNQQNLYMLQVLLSANGFKVELASNGAEALERARRAPPDMVISDILMPVMDGFALCRAWKGDERLKDIPFVFYTATYTDPKDEDFALSLGAERFIVKPVEPDKFLALLRDIIETHTAGKLVAPREPMAKEAEYYEHYNATLIRKLEDKVMQLEEANRALELGITERKQAEQVLRESEERFATIFRASPIGIILTRLADGRVSDVNEAFLSMFGYAREEVIGRTTLALNVYAYPNDRDRLIKLLREQGRLFGLEAQFRKKSGEIGDLLVSAEVLDLADERYMLSMMYDITERKQHERELETIAAMSMALRAAQTRAEMLPVILDQLLKLLQVEGAALSMRIPASGETLIELARGEWATWTGIRLSPGEGVSGQVIATGQPYVTDDVERDPQMTHRDLLGGLRAVACIPLTLALPGSARIAQEQTIGALWVGRKTKIADNEIRLLTAVGNIAANAIHRAALHEQTERRLRHLTALSEIDRAIISSFDIRLSLEILLNHVIAQLGVDAVDVLLLNSNSHTLDYVAGRGFHTKAVERKQWHLGEGYAGRAVSERQIVHIPNLVREKNIPFSRMLLAGEGFVSYYGVPLIAKGQVKGVLEIFHRVPLEPDEEWLGFLQALGGQAAIAIDNATLFDSLQRSNTELALAYNATIEGWSRALDLRDKETEGHTQRVADMTVSLARAFGMSEEELVQVRWGALLHDIGKMGVPDRILFKPSALTEEEWEVMRRHPTLAHEMLSPVRYLRAALDIPYCHHEKYDGTGYPRGLKGAQIPLTARIFAVVDVWDALNSDRPYRAAWPAEKAREHIRSLAGTHLDPKVVEMFLRSIGDE